MTDGHHEQRDFERFYSDMPIWIRVFEEDSEYKLVESANISAGGLLFEIDYGLKVGDQLDVSFELPQASELVKAVAVVRHVRVSNGLYHIGIQFETVENQTVDALMAYLEALFK